MRHAKRQPKLNEFSQRASKQPRPLAVSASNHKRCTADVCPTAANERVGDLELAARLGVGVLTTESAEVPNRTRGSSLRCRDEVDR